MTMVISLLLCAALGIPQANSMSGTGGTTAATSSSSTTRTSATERANSGTSATIILRTAVTSRGSLEGKQIKATLKQSVVLADGQTLPKGTALLGRIAKASPHSKTMPNGALMLLFDEAARRQGPPLALSVRIETLAQSVSSENATTALPGARLGGSANSGGAEQVRAERNDRSNLHSNMKQTGLTGVYLEHSPGGSGVAFALGEDVYLDEGVQLGVLLSEAAAPQPVHP